MRVNESAVDRIVRVLLGVAVAGFFIVWGHPAWALVGAIPVLTGLVGFCPLYRLLGISTQHEPKTQGP